MILLCGVLWSAAAQGNDRWVTAPDGGGLVITGYTGTLTSLVIPGEIGGVPVVGIGDNALSNRALVGITLPSSLRSIGERALAGNFLTTVEFPPDLLSIGAGAFSGNRLTAISLPPWVASIGGGAFTGNPLMEITVNVWSPAYTVEDGVLFSKDKSTLVLYPAARAARNYRVPTGVVSIGPEAFAGSPITGVSIGTNLSTNNSFPKNLDAVYNGNRRMAGTYLYDDPSKPGVWSYWENLLLQGDCLVQGTSLRRYIGGPGEVVIPANAGITEIQDNAFANAPITSVRIPQGILKIGNGAFENCTALSSVELPRTLTSIGNRAFASAQLSALTIPNAVTSIGDGAFSDNRLTGVTIPPRLSAIGDRVFSGNRLRSVTISHGVNSIGSRAFEGNQLTNLTIPPGVTHIGGRAFENNHLTTVVIGSGVGLNAQLGAFPDSFDAFYINGGKRAGRYSYTGSAWAYLGQ
jgi:hypothetical protein